jgi:hypothetical protein
MSPNSFILNFLTTGAKYRLPNVPRPRMSICILADAADIDRAKQIELEYMSVDDLKKCVSLFARSDGALTNGV